MIELNPANSDPTYWMCARCGQYNPADELKCLFCGAPVAQKDALVCHCTRCGQLFSLAAERCPRCGATGSTLTCTPTTVQTKLPEPGFWAQLGHILLIALGGLMVLAGLGLGVLLLFVKGTIPESALFITLILIGIVFIAQSWRALDPARWKASTKLPSLWIWVGWMVLAWSCGVLITTVFPQSVPWLLPPAIVLGALLPSLMFLSASLDGLFSPAERKPLLTQIGPRHIVTLTFALSATFSTTCAIVVEGITTGIVGLAMVVFAYLSGDTKSYEFLVSAIDEPAFLGSLEQMIVSSPLILVGLGSILVVLAPLIEETLKGIPLLAFVWPKSRQNERLAVLLGVAGGVGFAFAENIGYISVWAEEWALIFWFRVGAAVMHGAASGFVGRGWYRAIAQKRWLAAIGDFSKGLGIHALWNLLALLIGWFSYKGMQEGILFSIVAGLMPLAALFTIMARWGIWVSAKE